MTASHLGGWTGPEVLAQCGTAYKSYRAAKTESYRAYFGANLELKASDHEYKASDLAAALPEDWAQLSELLPVRDRHRHHVSGNSSQVIALGVLGVAARLDPSLAWVWDAFSPLPPATSSLPKAQFEYTLAPDVLGEEPRQTSVDFFVSDPAVLLCIEAKWTEAGIGGCGCGAAAAAIGDCSDKVRERKAYWDTARDLFGLPHRKDGDPCRLSFTYQAVRNVAAALALADQGQDAAFGLIYDAENPYFAGCGTWPGWPVALHATLDRHDAPVRFASVSWQELIDLAPLDAAAAAWASEKHGLHKAGAS